MKSTTITLGRLITKMEYRNERVIRITVHKMGEFESITQGYDIIELNGESTSGKFNRYESMLLSAGYQVSKIVEPKPVGGHSFIRIIYAKPN